MIKLGVLKSEVVKAADPAAPGTVLHHLKGER
jgi:hypothetical protein